MPQGATMTTSKSGIKCQVTIKPESMPAMAYIGIFKSTMDAIIDAMDRLGEAHGRISVKALP